MLLVSASHAAAPFTCVCLLLSPACDGDIVIRHDYDLAQYSDCVSISGSLQIFVSNTHTQQATAAATLQRMDEATWTHDACVSCSCCVVLNPEFLECFIPVSSDFSDDDR